MSAATALDWGLVDEVAPDGQAHHRARELAATAAAMPAVATRMIKEAVNAQVTALNRVASFADADQSQLTAGSTDARAARARFARKRDEG
jgi:enoyl-CoA hydratase/carnithine racemase